MIALSLKLLGGGGVSLLPNVVWLCQSSLKLLNFIQGRNLLNSLATKCRIRHDNADMNSVTFTLNQTCNPFSINAPVNLVNISSGKAENEETKKFLLWTLERGRKLRLQFVGECSVDGSRFFKPVARTKVFNFAAENMKQSKKKDPES